MSEPPLEINLEDNAKPHDCHTPAHIPIYWQKQVEANLILDEKLGILKPVLFGEPVIWCHCMIIMRKQNGSPRKAVDFSPLNKNCKREKCASELCLRWQAEFQKEHL